MIILIARMFRNIARESIAGYGRKSTEVDWVGNWEGFGLAMLCCGQ
ncbi:MAG: hypothetical protein F6K19_00725 [Cyanothece sp. SIO1E1]|nr:hypothetical protein [Cyanothece sp. SIO1E1]